jgi:hypothetical protein
MEGGDGIEPRPQPVAVPRDGPGDPETGDAEGAGLVPESCDPFAHGGRVAQPARVQTTPRLRGCSHPSDTISGSGTATRGVSSALPERV